MLLSAIIDLATWIRSLATYIPKLSHSSQYTKLTTYITDLTTYITYLTTCITSVNTSITNLTTYVTTSITGITNYISDLSTHITGPQLKPNIFLTFPSTITALSLIQWWHDLIYYQCNMAQEWFNLAFTRRKKGRLLVHTFRFACSICGLWKPPLSGPDIGTKIIGKT